MLTIYDKIQIPLAGVSLTSCFILFYILQQLPLSGFIVLIYGLNVSMTIRSSSYFLKLDPDNGEGLYLLIDMASDLASGLWTNIISITLLRMVSTLKTVNIRREMIYYVPFIFSVAISLALYEVIVYGLSTSRLIIPYRIFYYLRFSVVGFNLISFSISLYLATQLQKRVALKELSIIQADAIKVIVYRMQAYPLGQVIMRAGPLWHSYNSQSINDPAADYWDAIASPLCAFGYFIIFLYVQPIVRYKFIEGLVQCWNFITCNTCEWKFESNTDISGSKSDRPSADTRISRYFTNNQLLEIIESDDEYDSSFSTNCPSEIADSKSERYSTPNGRDLPRNLTVNSTTTNPMSRASEIEIT